MKDRLNSWGSSDDSVDTNNEMNQMLIPEAQFEVYQIFNTHYFSKNRTKISGAKKGRGKSIDNTTKIRKW